MLALAIDEIELIPAIFIFLPGFLELRGNISGSLAARLTSGLFVRALKPELKKSKLLYGNILAAILLSFVVSISIGLIAYFVNYFIFGVSSPAVIFVSIIACALSTVMLIPLTVIAVFWLFKHGHDPNNVMGPYITTLGDIISMMSIIVAIMLVKMVF